MAVQQQDSQAEHGADAEAETPTDVGRRNPCSAGPEDRDAAPLSRTLAKIGRT